MQLMKEVRKEKLTGTSRRTWVVPTVTTAKLTDAQSGAPPGVNDGIGFFMHS